MRVSAHDAHTNEQERAMLGAFGTLRARAAMLFVGALVAMLALEGYHILRERAERLSTIRERLRYSAELLTTDKNMTIGYTEQLVDYMVESQGLRQAVASEECHRALAERLEREPRLANIIVAVPDGTIVCSAIVLRHPVSIADRPFFRRALKTRALEIGAPVVGGMTSKYILPIGKALVSPSGHATRCRRARLRSRRRGSPPRSRTARARRSRRRACLRS